MRGFVLGTAALALLQFGCSCEERAPGSATSRGEGSTVAGAVAPGKRAGAQDGAPFSVTHVVKGSGAAPIGTDVVTVHYQGRLSNGVTFDSSIAPATFPLDSAIPCWAMGVAQMQAGGRATLVCPPETAYGGKGIPGAVPPNATLTFEIELIAIRAGPN